MESGEQNINKNEGYEIIKAIEEVTYLMNNRLDTLEDKLQGLIEINNRLVHENINLRSPPHIERKSNVDNTSTDDLVSNKIIIEKHGNGIKVHGKTYNYRSIFRDNGGSWNKGLQAWIFPLDVKETLIGVLNENSIEFEDVMF